MGAADQKQKGRISKDKSSRNGSCKTEAVGIEAAKMRAAARQKQQGWNYSTMEAAKMRATVIEAARQKQQGWKQQR